MIVFACGRSSPQGPDADTGALPDADNTVWQELVTGTWTQGAGTEGYWCARKTVTEDTYVSAFRDLAPLGTHHTVLTVDQRGGGDSEVSCAAMNITENMIFASGVGTDDYVFPAGVAVKVPAGWTLNLNIHLFNLSENDLTGVTGVLVQTIPVNEVVEEAEMVLAGPIGFSIPNGGDYTEGFDCTATHDHTLISVWPHMHQLGTYMQVEAFRGGNSLGVLHDLAFDFNDQINFPIAPLALQVGDIVRTTCTWNNNTGSAVGFGDSSLSEMCFSGLYRYPKNPNGGQFPFCFN